MVSNLQKSINFDSLSTDLLGHAETICRDFLPMGKAAGQEWVSTNPTRTDKTLGSFKVNMKTGRWKDFATTDKGGDLIGLVAYLNNSSQIEAARLLQKKYTVAPISTNKPKRENWEPILPVPEDAVEPLLKHYKHGKSSQSWRYKDIEGNLLAIVCRFEKDGKKEVLPFTYCENKDTGEKQWRWKGLTEPRPLYNLDKIANQPNATIIVTEGEKAADAAQKLFDSSTATTSMHGAQSPHKTDWAPLNGRKVIIWSDNDEPGRTYAQAVARLAKQVSAKEILIVNLEALKSDRDLPDGWDAADALEEGYTIEKLEALGSTLFTKIDLTDREKFSDDEPLSNFYLSNRGVYYRDADPEKEPRLICSPLRIMAEVRDQENENWGRLLQVTDSDGVNHQWCMPMEMLRAGGEEYRGQLLSLGLRIEPTATGRRLLAQYIQTFNPGKKARCVKKVGWHNDAFVLPDNVIQRQDKEQVYFQSEYILKHGIKAKGTLDEWKTNVAQKCKGNSRLVLAVCASLAPPLLHLLDVEGGGINLRGGSSIGKTTCLYAAASVWGNSEFIKNWRFTDNGIESVAAIHNHLPLLLDELAQVEAKQAGDIAYMLANGQGKGRANKSGATKSLERWRLLFLSTGEISLSEHSNSAGKRTTAGQEVRILDIGADAGAGFGVFESLHDCPGANDFALRIKTESNNYYGVAGPAFIRKLQSDNKIPEKFKKFRDLFLEKNVPDNADGQVRRAAERFAVVAFAGELASEHDITGWNPDSSISAISKCFKSWISARGGVGPREQSEMLAQVRFFLEQYGESRFTLMNALDEPEDRVALNRAGFRKQKHLDKTIEYEYFIFREVFRNEICKGFNYLEVAKLLCSRTMLESSTDGQLTRSERLPGIGKIRVYKLTTKAMDGEPEENQAPKIVTKEEN